MPLISLALAAMMGTAQVRFPHPDRIRYDGQCFTIDGKDTFIFSGAFHYFRCPKELWADRFERIKEAGFNTVETYVAWNKAEPAPPRNENDFSKIDLRELDEWLTMAERAGLNVIVRPGPYICAEWDAGGFPHWLIAKKPANTTRRPWLRSDDPEYLRWVRHYMRAVTPVVAKHQITRKPMGAKGVILFQIENEYDYIGGGDAVHVGQLRELAKDAIEGGIDVPLITCWTRQVRGSKDPLLSQAMDCPNLYPRYGVTGVRGSLRDAKRSQPQAPLMVTEMQGGWFSENGGKLAEDQEGIDARQINQLTLYCIQNDLTALNYYMLFGGTNFGLWTPPNITTSYDYYAPIREDGSVGTKYAAVKALGDFIAQNGSGLVRSVASPEKGKTDSSDVEVALRTAKNGDRYIFVRNTNVNEPHSGTAQIAGLRFAYDLGSFGMKVLVVPAGTSEGSWWPRPMAQPMLRMQPAPTIRLASAERWPERLSGLGRPIWEPSPRKGRGPALSESRREGEGVSVKPGLSQLWPSPQRSEPSLEKLGVLDNRYVGYKGSFAGASPSLWLRTTNWGDATVEVDGRRLAMGRPMAGGRLFQLPAGAAGRHSLTILYENPGYPNGGNAIEDPHGVLEARLINETVASTPLAEWESQTATGREDAVAKLSSDSGWESVQMMEGRQLPIPSDSTRVYRRTVDDSGNGQTLLHIDAVDDDAWIYVNGKLAGESHVWDQQIDLDLKPLLHAGANTLAIVAHNAAGEGGVNGVPTLRTPLPAGVSIPLRLVENLDGPRGAGETIRLATDVEIPHKLEAIGAPHAAGSGFGHWYRLTFTLPSEGGNHPTRSLRIAAQGNGTLTLNGKPLGRVWSSGPQREYYLPQPWLRFGGRNEILIFLRDAGQGESLSAAEVRPYTAIEREGR